MSAQAEATAVGQQPLPKPRPKGITYRVHLVYAAFTQARIHPQILTNFRHFVLELELKSVF